MFITAVCILFSNHLVQYHLKVLLNSLGVNRIITSTLFIDILFSYPSCKEQEHWHRSGIFCAGCGGRSCSHVVLQEKVRKAEGSK